MFSITIPFFLASVLAHEGHDHGSPSSVTSAGSVATSVPITPTSVIGGQVSVTSVSVPVTVSPGVQPTSATAATTTAAGSKSTPSVINGAGKNENIISLVLVTAMLAFM
ncbi:hypothetical protein BC833DRAFT_603477 [Globomyces pollinis-pini]|nr:hypothetical protein BC833DRAFT_603477 [Globomyces pollinis-pini]